MVLLNIKHLRKRAAIHCKTKLTLCTLVTRIDIESVQGTYIYNR